MTTKYLGYQEITDDIARKRYGAAPGDKLFVSRVRIDGEKFVEILLVQEVILTDAQFPFEEWMEQTAIRSAEENR